ncbi:secreted protein [Melampsora americana]|nr:secreted protein [Melampsora americana]
MNRSFANYALGILLLLACFRIAKSERTIELIEGTEELLIDGKLKFAWRPEADEPEFRYIGRLPSITCELSILGRRDEYEPLVVASKETHGGAMNTIHIKEHHIRLGNMRRYIKMKATFTNNIRLSTPLTRST